MAYRLENKQSGESLHLISLPGNQLEKLRWINEKEFIYEGELYDLAGETSRNDSVFYLCVKDEKEKKLNDHLGEHLEIQVSDNTSSSRKTPVISKLFLKKFIAPLPVFSPGMEEHGCLFPVEATPDPGSLAISVESPPPDIS